MKLTEVRKEDDYYFEGPFWVVGDSIKSIRQNKFKLIAVKSACTADGKVIGSNEQAIQHKKLWPEYGDGVHSATYYPRGRVSIYKGTAYVNITPILNDADIIDAIIKEYCLDKLDIDIECKYGAHYNFEMEE